MRAPGSLAEAGAPTEAAEAAPPAANQGGPTTLAEARRAFATKPTPRLIAAYLVVVVAVRVALGRWHPIELVVPAAVLVTEPFTEWLIHVVVLHWRPRTVAGRTVDLYAGRKHRQHHADPRNLDMGFVPIRLLFVQLPVLLGLGVLFLPGVRIGLTLAISALTMLLVYEWTHYLVHAPYAPKSRYYRALWRAHRLHHFRNEHYWFGVTVHLADHALGTFPRKGEVPLSGTARSLGVQRPD